MAGIGGGILTVPFLYLVYARTGTTLSAQTVVAHATSLGVAFAASAVGTWHYARARAIAWRAAAFYAIPGVASAFGTARILTRMESAHWVRGAFGAFLIVIAWDMARRAWRGAPEAVGAPHQHSWAWLVSVGLVGGMISALLGIGGGLIAVPVFIYVGKLPVKTVAPTALAGVCLTTMAGGLGYVTAGVAPAVSPLMLGFLDLRMALPLALGAMASVPIGVRMNRRSRTPTLYWLFAALFATIGLTIVGQWSRSGPG